VAPRFGFASSLEVQGRELICNRTEDAGDKPSAKGTGVGYSRSRRE